MKIGLIAGIIIAIAIIGIIGFLTLSNFNTNQMPSNGDTNSNNGLVNDENNNPDTNTNTLNPQTYEVDIINFAYSPKTMTIKAGDTITWTNKDSVRHTITSDSGNELDSSLLNQGQTYSHTFNQKGTFDYHCTPHPYMKAKIIVE